MRIRYIAHIIMEAQSPLKVGSNASDFLQDSPVQKDWNDLPMILGTSIAGVLRKSFGGGEGEVFGKEDGSKIIFSNALLLDENGKVNEGLLFDRSDFLSIFDHLPIREHTAITDKGVARDNSKFDEEVVYKGARFKFSIEMPDDKEAFEKIIDLLLDPAFRLGGGTTKGFGKFKILKIMSQAFDEEGYLGYSNSLNDVLADTLEPKETLPQKYTNYTLKISPDDFFMFGSGFGDSDADSTPVYEKVVDYPNAKLSDAKLLIPASSIKGALSHRTAFHYNKAAGDTIESGNAKTGEENDAVKAVFGHKKELAADSKTELGQKGRVLLSDCFKENRGDTKVFDHVSIDRFTGGAIDGALFQEKTIAQKDVWEIEVLLEKGTDETYVKAFEMALDDICRGMLPLGGMTTKGHGIFTGVCLKDGEVLNVER